MSEHLSRSSTHTTAQESPLSRVTGKQSALRALTVLLFACSLVHAQEKPADENKDERYEWRDQHDPNGIGKFYKGREIAHVTGGIPWLERTEREKEERLSLLVKSLKLKPGDRVADIGAGAGVISMLMAEQVLDDGYVLAVDVQDQMLLRIQENARKQGLTNVIPIKGSQKSPSLAPSSVDLVIMVDVYHEFEFPHEIMTEITKAIRPGGRLVFVEYRKEDPTVPIKVIHKMTQKQVRLEMDEPVFQMKWKETIDVLPWQHIMVFTKLQPPDRF